jgi:hypothetical protein
METSAPPDARSDDERDKRNGAARPDDAATDDAPETPPPLFASEDDVASDMRALDPSIRTVWSIERGLAALVVLILAFGYDLTHLFASDPWIPFGVPTGVVLVLGLAWALGWPRVRYRTWRFTLRPEELVLTHGVLNHVRTVVPLRRVQHLDVSQNLVEREFGLGKLIVHTAGSRSSDVVIPGLRLDEAERVRDEVKRFILEDPLMEDPV